MARVYKRDDSPYWYADFYDRNGERIQKSTHRERKRDAQALADQWERESLRDPVEVARETATFRAALDLLSAYLHESVKAGTMAHDTATHYVQKAQRLKAYFGDARLLRTIDTAAVRDYCAARRHPHAVTRKDGSTQTFRGAGNHTLTKEVNCLRLAMRLAKERGLWSGDLDTLQPAELSARYAPRKRVVTPDDAWKLREPMMRRSPGRWALVAYALATGAEKAALFRAHRADVDAARTWVHVRGTKRATRDRPVPVLLEECRHLLDDALAHADGDRPREGATPEEQARAARRPLFRAWPNVSRDLKVACAAAGIEALTLNDLRRSWATWHVEAGVSLDTLFRPMGHVDTVMLARTYARPDREVMAEQMRAQIQRARKPKKGGDET